MKTTIHTLLVVIFCLALPSFCAAHEGSVRGVVYDNTGKKPLQGATVTVDSTLMSVVTDAFGKFFLKNLDPGRHTLAISYIGREPVKQDFIVEEGATTDLTFHLFPTAVTMNDIAITGMKDLKLTTIKMSEMNLRPVNNSQDLLRLVPGLFIAQHQGGGKAEQIFIRGFDCDHGTDINISVDNMPVNMTSHAHGQGFADAHFIIPESIQQLDYGKGPYEADKGNFYTGGYIAFKTKNSLDNNFASAEGGTYNYLRTATGFNLLNSKKGNSRHSDAYVIGEYVYNRGYFDAPQDLNRFSITGKYTNYISDNKQLSATISGFNTFWNASGQLPERAVNSGLVGMYGELDKEGGATSRYNLNVAYDQKIDDNNHFKSNLYLTQYNFLLYSNFTFFANDPVNGDQIRQAENRKMAGYNAEYTNNTSRGVVNFKTQVGVGIRYDDVNNSELSSTVGKTVLLNRISLGDINDLNLSGYASEKIQLWRNLTFNLGVRYDVFVQQYTNKLPLDEPQATAETYRLSPKAGVCYKITDDIKAYYSYGTGLHSNDSRTIHLNQQLGGSVYVGNIVPQAFGHDLGIEYILGSKLLLSAAIWRLDLQQEFGYSGDAAVVDTSGRSRRQGIDFSTRYVPFKRLSLYLDVNFAQGRFLDQPDGENYIALAPAITSTGGAKYNITKNIAAGLHYRHLGDRPANDDNSLVATGYTIFDAAMTYSRPNADYSIQVQNLFNTQWREAQFETETRLRTEVASGMPAQTDICFTPGTPLFFKVGATFKF